MTFGLRLMLLAAPLTGGSAASPMDKAISMLADLKKTVSDEGVTEEKNYAAFKQFCTASEDKKTEAIKIGTDEIESSTATIAQKKAAYDEALATISERKTQNEKLEAEKDASKRECSESEQAYLAKKADLSEAMISLETAITKVSAASNAKVSTGFLQFGSDIQQSLDLASAMGILQEPKRQEVTGFLQSVKAEPEGAEKKKANYEFQSSGIVSTLKDLLKEFKAEHQSSQDEWGAASKLCEETATLKSEQINQNTDAIATAEGNAASLKGEESAAKGSLLETKKLLKDDKAALTELQENCDARAADFKQRSKSRTDEVAAISKALEVLKAQVASPAAGSAPSFFQQNLLRRSRLSSVNNHFGAHQKESSNVVGLAVKSSLEVSRLNVALQERVISQLATAGTELSSVRLSGLASRLQRLQSSRDTPLSGVKDLVNGMLQNLLNESTSETSDKGFCDAQMAKAKKNRDRYSREVMKINSKLKSLDAKRVELGDEAEVLAGDISRLEADLNKASQLRADESQANLKAVKEAKQGSEAVAAAISALKKFYKDAARKASQHDTALLQKGSASSRKGQANPGFDGSYAGKQSASQSVISMMEIVHEDFSRTASETETSEKSAAEKFSKLKQDLKVELTSRSTAKTLSEEELEETMNALASGKAELASTTELLDGELRALEELKPRCVDNKATYEELKAKREQEIAQLKAALCALDPQGTEPGCSGSKTSS
eukprot:TRINITY_DN72805_c0_g1_i1.p1 TRINITY_DN72805_c0_g1~~TRINITY_DN72805_c0_g1_i1.p1  ORF type:complete len:726 (-),score=219.38 TRINITY_DN72805_c0_g1_i1:93-2270(-)